MAIITNMMNHPVWFWTLMMAKFPGLKVNTLRYPSATSIALPVLTMISVTQVLNTWLSCSDAASKKAARLDTCSFVKNFRFKTMPTVIRLKMPKNKKKE